jgi:cell division protein FtsB
LANDLRKNKKNPPNWEEGFKTLQAEWRKFRDEVLPNGATTNTKNLATEEDKNAAAKKENLAAQTDNDSNSSPKSSMLIYFILLAMMGGIGFLVYQNLQLKQQIVLLEEDLQERYSRLDNRIDSMTPLKEFKSLSLKLVQTNDQLSALMQEVINLQVKTSDEERLSPEEIYAQRTAHLESQYTADVQIYYAKPYENSHYFLPHDFRTEPTRENFFKIEMHLDDAQQVFYRIVDRSEYQNLALTQLDTTLKPYVELMNHLNNPARILTLEPGVLEKKNNAWVITKKAKVLLE